MITLASLMCMAVTPSFINGSQQKPESVSELTKTEKIGTTDTVMTDIVKKEESSEKVSDNSSELSALSKTTNPFTKLHIGLM